jgi:hypothetical protein
MNKTIIYYTCNAHKPEIDDLARSYLSKTGLPIISVSLNKKLDFGDIRIVMHGERSPLMMHKQIIKGLKACKTKYAFLAESDVLYHPSHFKFTPKQRNEFYFNVNVWKQKWPLAFFIRTDNSQQLSGMSAYKSLLLDWFESRLEEIEKQGFNRHYEPRGNRINYSSEIPNICIRHDKNLTVSKWSVNDFRNKEYAKGWTEANSVPGWNVKQLLNLSKP